MKTISLLLLVLALPLQAEDFNPFEGPKPIAMYLLTSHGSFGSTPYFAVYEDGDVIYRTGEEGPWKFYYYRLAEEELKEFRSESATYFEYTHLKDWYDHEPGTMDVGWQYFYLQDEGKEFVTIIHGSRRNYPGSSTSYKGYLQEYSQLRTLFNNLQSNRAVEWIPDYVEVVLSEDPEWEGETVAWPDDWPSLNSNRVQLREKEFFSVFIDGQDWQTAVEIWHHPTLNRVQIEDSTYLFLGVGEVLPSQNIWNAALIKPKSELVAAWFPQE